MLVDAVRYQDGIRAASGDLIELVRQAESEGGFVWVGLRDPTAEEIREIVDVFDFHPLVVEDAVKARQHPKVERYGDLLFVVMRTARYLAGPETVEVGEIQIFCHEHSIVVIRHGPPAPLDQVRQALEKKPTVLDSGPVAVLYAVLDDVVDRYEAVLAGLDDDVSELELEVFAPGRPVQSADIVERIYFLQREILELHRAIHPLMAAMSTLREDPLVAGRSTWDAYFRDINDHLVRQAAGLQTIRELISAALAANTAQVSLRQNDDMRRISAWVAIGVVPTLISGIYGMNFTKMPGLDWAFGYLATLTVMAIVCLALYRAFRRSGWL